MESRGQRQNVLRIWSSVDDCPDCGDPHTGYCRQALGRMLADQTVEYEHDRDELMLKLAEHEARIRELEREQREWH